MFTEGQQGALLFVVTHRPRLRKESLPQMLLFITLDKKRKYSKAQASPYIFNPEVTHIIYAYI